MPLYEAHQRFVLGSRVLHADETPVAMLDPGAGKTKKAYIWAYARGAFDPEPGVVYDFCLGRGGQYPSEFAHAVGRARWSSMPTAAMTRPCACRGASLSVAWRMRGENSTSWSSQRQRGGAAGDPAHRLALPDRGRRADH